MKRDSFLTFFFLYLLVYKLGYSQEKEKLPLIKSISVFKLDHQVNETSGLIFFNNSFWTINDSGNSPILYRFSPQNGEVTQKITISNAHNIDWEELSEDEKYIYIADIGDNDHEREKKQIYRIPKSNILKIKGNSSIKAEVILFSYPEIDGKKTNFNAEALFVLDDNIHLFTKDLFVSYHFTIPAKPGKKIATYIEKFSSNGMVTGAALDKKSKTIVLVGYMGFGDRLLWKVSQTPASTFFKGKIQSFSLGKIGKTSQVEAVCFSSNGKIYFSNENFMGVKQQLWEFQKDQLK